MPFGARGGDGARPDGSCGRGVPTRWTRARQSGLPPRRRPYRLDRSADDRSPRLALGNPIEDTPVDAAVARSIRANMLHAYMPDPWMSSMPLADLVAPNAVIPA